MQVMQEQPSEVAFAELLSEAVGDVGGNAIEAANKIFRQVEPNLLIWARSEIAARNLALDPRDLVQETVLRALKQLPSFRGNTKAQFLSCLKRILIRRASGYHQRAAVDMPVSIDDSKRGIKDAIPGAEETPSKNVARTETRDSLSAALKLLDPEERQVVELFMQSRSFPEIGGIMQRSPDAVRHLRNKAVRNLREMLGSEQKYF
jgi:RNA polymerase sigma-70 factor (ECF subfamily)